MIEWPGRLEFRTEHPLYLWVASELVRRFTTVVAVRLELESTDHGLTREGWCGRFTSYKG